MGSEHEKLKPVEALRASFGYDSVVTDGDVLSSFLTDWTGRFTGTALAMVRPADAEQVVRVVEIAHDTHTPIVIQGGNTGLVGGATPTSGGILLSLSAFKGIEIDPIARSARVGSGVTLGELNAAAFPFGLMFGVDLASRDTATIGGMIATNAGGIHLIKYGGTRQQLLGIEAVFGTGVLIRRMEGLQKDNSGYDWASLLCGSEGTLAIITRAVVKLVSVPEHRTVSLISLATMPQAVELMSDLRKRFDAIQAIEFVSKRGLELVAALRGSPWPMGEFPGFALLVELAGDKVDADGLAEYLSGRSEIIDAVLAVDSGLQGLWMWREDVSLAISAVGIPHKYDVTIPIVQISRFLTQLDTELASDGRRPDVVVFGHLGDGNVHVNLLEVDPDDDEIDDLVLSLTASFGGSISAEHGIGRAKAKYLTLTRSAQDVALMRSLKHVFDPEAILNPGVIFSNQYSA